MLPKEFAPLRKPPGQAIPFNYCPKFDSCSVNQCPLDHQFYDHPTLPEDPEKKCTTRKRTRLEIVRRLREVGNAYVDELPFGGLTRMEEAGRQRREAFAALPEDERQRILSRLSPFSGVNDIPDANSDVSADDSEDDEEDEGLVNGGELQ